MSTLGDSLFNESENDMKIMNKIEHEVSQMMLNKLFLIKL